MLVVTTTTTTTTTAANHITARLPQKEHERVLETGVFPSLDRVTGTHCLSHYVTETSH